MWDLLALFLGCAVFLLMELDFSQIQNLKSLQQKFGEHSQDLDDWKIWMEICDEQGKSITQELV